MKSIDIVEFRDVMELLRRVVEGRSSSLLHEIVLIVDKGAFQAFKDMVYQLIEHEGFTHIDIPGPLNDVNLVSILLQSGIKVTVKLDPDVQKPNTLPPAESNN
jgi:hypothetical protein